MRTALIVVFAIALVVISAPFAFSIWSRRGERKPDRPGERTVVSFHGGARYTTEGDRTTEASEGSVGCGEGMAKAIADGLRARGVAVDDPERDDVGWGFFATASDERAYVLLAQTEEEELSWFLRILDPSSGGPGPASLRAHIDAALQMLDVTDVIWQRR